METNLETIFSTDAALHLAQSAALWLVAAALTLLVAWAAAAGFASRRA